MNRPSKLSLVPALTCQAELLAMLSFRRPAWSNTEREFINRFIRPLGMQEDNIGNLYKRIGDAPIVWSCHTDTAHERGGKQLLSFANGIVKQSDPKSDCLGADCTAGVWLMVQMIRAKRPGLYIFHRAEEIGGIGSSFIAEDTPGLLAGILYAVAFDRRGTSSIITHQAGGRCCSEAFAGSFSKALGMAHRADSGGSFTDTANYTGLIGECSNLSVGYENEHRPSESLDTVYLERLCAALLQLDCAALVSERVPGAIDEEEFGDWPNVFDQEPLPHHYGDTIAHLVRDHPDEVADWLEEYGITADEIATAIYMRGGMLKSNRRG